MGTDNFFGKGLGLLGKAFILDFIGDFGKPGEGRLTGICALGPPNTAAFGAGLGVPPNTAAFGAAEGIERYNLVAIVASG